MKDSKLEQDIYSQIINTVYNKYAASHWIPPVSVGKGPIFDQLWGVIPMKYSKELFAEELKNNVNFAKKWGVQVNKRMLTLKEREQLYIEFNIVSIEAKNKFPTKLITLTYDSKSVQIYE